MVVAPERSVSEQVWNFLKNGDFRRRKQQRRGWQTGGVQGREARQRLFDPEQHQADGQKIFGALDAGHTSHHINGTSLARRMEQVDYYNTSNLLLFDTKQLGRQPMLFKSNSRCFAVCIFFLRGSKSTYFVDKAESVTSSRVLFNCRSVRIDFPPETRFVM